MAEATYEIRLKDQSGLVVARFVGAGRGDAGGGLQSFTYNKRLRTPGSHVVTIYGNDDRLAYLDLDEVGTLDSQFEFWRRDIQGGLDWYKDFETFHRSMEFRSGAEGREVFVSWGRGYNDLLTAETILWPAGSAEAQKNAAAETVAKEFVDENIGPGALAASGRFRDGNFAGLSVEADTATGATWSGKRAFDNLLDVLTEIGDYGPGDYWIIGTGAATFEFQWRDVRWGEDRTKGNAAGNPPVTFSRENQNATNIRYNYSRLDEATHCDVLGGGQGASRLIETSTSGGETDSPWARRAVARDARDEIDPTILQDRGEETINKQLPRRSFTFDAIQTRATRYGRDWRVGDLVTLTYRGRDIDQKIVGVTVSMGEDGKEDIAVETEDE